MRELLGELLLEAKRPAEAARAFEMSLRTAPNRFRSQRVPDRQLTCPVIAREHASTSNDWWHLHATRTANGRHSPVRGSFWRRRDPARPRLRVERAMGIQD